MRLALDVGLAGLALGIERIELEVEVMLGGFARVDRAPQHLPFRLGHRCTFCRARREETVARPAERGASAVRGEVTLSTSRIPLRLGRTPKKRGPLQPVPVMARAMVVRLRYVLSPQRKPSATTVTVCRSP